MKLSLFSIPILLSGALMIASSSNADTVYLKNGKEVKGIVVEDYRDRITFSTADGETMISKADIREISFDSEEDNLVQLAGQAQVRGDYSTSFYYYEKAFKMNPASKMAKDGMVFLQGYLYRQGQLKKEADVAKMADFENYGGAIVGGEPSRRDELTESFQKLRDSIGITLNASDSGIVISGVELRSTAWEAGVKRGDRLIAIWSKLTGYMPLKDVVEMLLKKSPMETRCTIERTVAVAIDRSKALLAGVSDLIGCDFSMEFDGLTISKIYEGGSSAAAGIEAGDLVVDIDGNPTRYMPLKKAIDMIKDSNEDTVKLTIRREVVLWSQRGG